MNISTLAAAFALCLTTLGAQATVINLDAKVDGLTVVETFAAGTYDVQWIGASNGGLYDAWGASTSSTGEAGHAKYRDAFAVSFNGATAQIFGSFGPYTPDTSASALAFAKANPSTFTFATPTVATFSIPDNKGQFGDNNGGVSLNITAAVPEPETYALMLAGLGTLGFVARRRQRG